MIISLFLLKNIDGSNKYPYYYVFEQNNLYRDNPSFTLKSGVLVGWLVD